MDSRRGKKLSTLLDLCVSSLRRGHANLLCIVPIFADDLVRGSSCYGMDNYIPLASASSAPLMAQKKIFARPRGQKKQVPRGRAGIEPATSRTQSGNHTTRPTALKQAYSQKHARRDSNPQPPDSKSDALSIAPRAPHT